MPIRHRVAVTHVTPRAPPNPARPGASSGREVWRESGGNDRPTFRSGGLLQWKFGGSARVANGSESPARTRVPPAAVPASPTRLITGFPAGKPNRGCADRALASFDTHARPARQRAAPQLRLMAGGEVRRTDLISAPAAAQVEAGVSYRTNVTLGDAIHDRGSLASSHLEHGHQHALSLRAYGRAVPAPCLAVRPGRADLRVQECGGGLGVGADLAGGRAQRV
ncbi:hypothetical protein GobsT_51990 [Gemmata obscuriglobus]|nr:hypothetical protein GobsT_51990 [Gemmata obscuriglobus]VTS09718.1 unnamed protein product [Gemmata obscuriglobus UQM 2246]